MSPGVRSSRSVWVASSRRERSLAAAVAILLALSVGACDALTKPPTIAAGTVIDGFPVVGSATCGNAPVADEATETHSCPAWTAMAALALDAREPGHPPIVGFSVHALDVTNRAYFGAGDPDADPARPVMVMRLEDDTLRAVAIDCDSGPCRANDEAPMRIGSELMTACRFDTTKRSDCQEVLTVATAELEARLPDHGAIVFTRFDSLDDAGQYIVEFVVAHGPDLRVTVDCTPESCAARSIP
jgi:hypothetical protein